MKPVEFWKWHLHGSRKPTTWRMREEEAREHDPDAQRVPGTMELRNVPESPDEHEMTGAWRNKPRAG
jgi:hypothetical protein